MQPLPRNWNVCVRARCTIGGRLAREYTCFPAAANHHCRRSMTTPALLEFPSPFAAAYGVIRLLPEAGRTPAEVLAQVAGGQYDRPFLIDDGDSRSLYFSLIYVQSVMNLHEPLKLEAAYTREMMGFLLFQPNPQRILLCGLGGGSLLKFCHARLPNASCTAVEIDPDVIAFREQFLIPPDGPRLAIVEADAADYAAQCPEAQDVILLDAFDRHGFSATTSQRSFYQDLRAVLTANGVLVANMVGSRDERLAHINLLRSVFEDNVLIVTDAEDGNFIAVAFRNPHFEPRWRWIKSQAPALEKRYGLPLVQLADKFERSRKLGYLDRILATL